MQGLKAMIAAQGIPVYENEPMAKHTTFRIGGPAECYVIPDDAEQIRKTVALAGEAGVPCHIIGNGSNLLVSDDGVPGIVSRNVSFCKSTFSFLHLSTALCVS